jgi:hypothetical protein
MRYIFLLCLWISCSQKAKNIETNSLEKDSVSITDSIFVGTHGGYGYAILVDGKVMIHQPHIPVIRGSIGFASEEKAKRTAQFVIAKMIKGGHQRPPSISLKELDSLEVN